MKTREEIKRILTDELGFTDLEAYKKWIAEERAKIRPTKKRVERLSPDTIDNRAFWRVCEEIFGEDPVCNLAVKPAFGELPYEIEGPMDANRMNLRLARCLGVTAFLDENAHARVRTLEVGPGYGSLKHYIETFTNHRYLGVDVYPRISGVVETTAEGWIPPEIVAGGRGEFSYVISTNVFQHLSARQRVRYYADAAVLLHEGGLFIFNLTVDSHKVPANQRDDSGTAWADHYGQYTPLPKVGDLHDQLGSSFRILYMTQRYDGLFNFVCRRD